MKLFNYIYILITDFIICHHSWKAFFRRRKARRERDSRIAAIEKLAKRHIEKLRKYGMTDHVDTFQKVTDARILLELTKPLPID